MHILLTAAEQEQAFALLQHKKIARRTILLQPGNIDRHIYFVSKGCLRMFYT